MVSEIVSINGEIQQNWDANILLRDHGALFAENVFEGIRIIGGKLLDYQQHRARLYSSAKHLDLPIVNPEQLDQFVSAALKFSQIKEGYIRLVATRGAGGLGIDPRKCINPKLFVFVGQLALYPEETYQSGVNVIFAKTRKIPRSCINCTDIKHGNYLNNKLAFYEALRNEAHDGLMLTVDGFVCEASVANVFAVIGNKLITPTLDTNCLRGITRASIIEIATMQGVICEEGFYTAKDFLQVDEAFLTGTGAGILAVRAIDGKLIGNGSMGEVTRSLRNSYLAELEKVRKELGR